MANQEMEEIRIMILFLPVLWIKITLNNYMNATALYLKSTPQQSSLSGFHTKFSPWYTGVP